MNLKSVSTAVMSAAMILGLCQCNQPAATTNAQQEQAPIAVSGLKIAYVDVDSLLANYAFYQDLAEEMMRKQENYSLVLEEERKKIDQDIKDFNKKVESNVFSSAERQNSEYNRIGRRQQSLEEKAQKYSQELMEERDANSQKISETVNDFIAEYNKAHGYNLIISKASLLFADEALNITAEVLEGLNAAYNQASK
jgi:outer membrane protein